MTSETDLRDSIDDYTDTIFAIVGFVNFYRFDDETRQMKEEVIVFQGRRLTPSPAKAITPKGHRRGYVTPDLGVLYGEGRGVLGDAKKSFPRDRTRWDKPRDTMPIPPQILLPFTPRSAKGQA